MSRPRYLTKDNAADFINNAVYLAAWTLKWCKDERLFPRRERWIITGDIWDAAKRIVRYAKIANSRNPETDDYEARRDYLKLILDALNDINMCLTIKYEMISKGFDAPSQPVPLPPGKNRGKPKLTLDDIDRIFETFFQYTISEEDLVKGLLESDKKRRDRASH